MTLILHSLFDQQHCTNGTIQLLIICMIPLCSAGVYLKNAHTHTAKAQIHLMTVWDVCSSTGGDVYTLVFVRARLNKATLLLMILGLPMANEIYKII